MLCAAAPDGRARAERGVIEAYAHWVAAQGKWKGPTTPYPDVRPRPRPPLRLDSARLPLHVHAQADVDPARVQRALAALEDAHLLLQREGWPAPYPDGGAGETPGFDLYLLAARPHLAAAHADAPIHWDALDAAASHAVVDAAAEGELLHACVLSAYAQAALLGQDPAEPEAHRRATAAFIVDRIAGELPCGADPGAAQAEPEAGLFGETAGSVAATGELLRQVSLRHDGGSGRFVRELWQLARQRSEEVVRLRSSPNLVEALQLGLENAGEDLEQASFELAVARADAAHVVGRGLWPAPRTVQLPGYGSLPAHPPPHDPGLGPYGSAYAEVDVGEAGRGRRLQVWLRGEPGARWSLTGVRLDDRGRELGRVSIPALRTPRSFLPLELTDDTARVRLVVVRLPAAPVDLRVPAGRERWHFRLILDGG
ncbi:MAG: hypothetical protein PVI30_15050 [Myxococcales bacterium]